MLEKQSSILYSALLKSFKFSSSYVDSTRRLAVNLSGGAGEDLKKMMAEHNMMVKEDHQNDGISLDVQYLKQAEHLMRTSNFKAAVKYTHKALEINPEYTVSKPYSTFQSTAIRLKIFVELLKGSFTNYFDKFLAFFDPFHPG